jgi:hypothetical protein
MFDRIEPLGHLELLELVAAEYDQATDVRVTRQDRLDEGLAERSGSAGDQDRLAIQHYRLHEELFAAAGIRILALAARVNKKLAV